MPKITVPESEVKEAVAEFKHDMTDGDCSVDTSEAEWNELTKAVNDEYECGFKGSVYDCIVDLSDTIDLDTFKIYVII